MLLCMLLSEPCLILYFLYETLYEILQVLFQVLSHALLQSGTDNNTKDTDKISYKVLLNRDNSTQGSDKTPEENRQSYLKYP